MGLPILSALRCLWAANRVPEWQIDLASAALKNHGDVGFNELGEKGRDIIKKAAGLGCHGA